MSSEDLAVGVLFVAVATLACMAPVQSDTWWLLRAGQEIWRSGTVPLADSYSHTAVGLFWPNHEWLTEAVFYALFVVGGLPFVTFVAAAAIVAAWRLSWRAMTGAFELRLVLFALPLMSAATSWAVRPQVFTLLAVMLTALWTVRRQYTRLPLLFLVWANFHGAVAIGLGMLVAAAVAETIAERRAPWRLLVATAASGLATMLSPLGRGLWSFIPASMERSRLNELIEWLPPDAAPGLWPFWLMAALLVVAGLLRFRALDREALVLSAMAGGLLVLAVQSRRNIAVFLLVAAPAVSHLLRPYLAPTPNRGKPERGRLNAVLLGGVALAAALFVGLTWSVPPNRLGWRPIATEAVEAIRRCDGPIYNTYGEGGVLIWFVPDVPVFIDNRQDHYPIDLLQANRRFELSGDAAGLLDRYQIRCAAVPSGSVVAGVFDGSSAWARQYADHQWVVFNRAGAASTR